MSKEWITAIVLLLCFLIGCLAPGAEEQNSSLPSAFESAWPTTNKKNGAEIFQEKARSVVLVVSEEGIGSGAIVDRSGAVITNWHVVEGSERVLVIYKPEDTKTPLEELRQHHAKVEKVDEIADLALLRIADPNPGISALKISDRSNLKVASVVHAIGHPTGETWTYTRGYVSQVRDGYKWEIQGQAHQADVVQTQTPINPGNSGGPLLDSRGAIVGLNTFKAEGEGLNFAVRSTEIRRFLARGQSRRREERDLDAIARGASQCEGEILSERPRSELPGSVFIVDSNCDGVGDAERIYPDDPQRPIFEREDIDQDGSWDVIRIDDDRNGSFDASYFDTDGDGYADVVGYHEDGGQAPALFEEMPSDSSSNFPLPWR